MSQGSFFRQQGRNPATSGEPAPQSAYRPGGALGDVLRIPTEPQLSGQRRSRVESAICARNINAAGEYPDGTSVEARSDTPDPRLLATIAFAFRPDLYEEPTTAAPFAGHAVSADQWLKTKEGLWVRGNHIRDLTVAPISDTFGAPWSYRYADTPGQVRASLIFPNAGTDVLEDGNWWAIFEWNLAPGAEIRDGELSDLLAACTYTTGAAPTVYGLASP